MRIALLLLFAVATAQAQVTVEVILKQRQYLRDESVPVSVRIVNRAGRALELGKTPDWLTFTVEGADGRPVKQNAFLDLTEPFILNSAAAATKGVDLIPSFALSQPGRYTVRAHVQVPGLETPLSSSPEMFDLGRGVEVWAQEFGVPGKENEPVQTRRYSLLQAQYRTRPMLYIRVADATDTDAYGVVALGPVVSFSRPEKVLDQSSRLHVLFQSGAQSFLYCVVDPTGGWVKRQTYSYFRTRPSLRNEEGEIRVVGGLRRISPTDFPSTQEQTELTDAEPSSP